MAGFTTTILHNDRQSLIEHGSVHKPIHTAVTYGYSDARELAEVFQGKKSGYRYGRQGNPTVTALEDKLTKMEDGVASLCFASGMAAIGALPLALLKSGDHVVSSAFLFGNTSNLWQTAANLGVEVSFVDATNVANVEAAITKATRMVFVETIANPRTQVVDLAQIGALCQARGILFVVDNTMTSPYLFRPKAVGAGLVINSLTKAISGHGDVLGGCITDTGAYDWRNYPNIAVNFQKQAVQQWGIAQLRAKSLRDFGACLSPDAAHQIAIGAETMALRIDRQCSNTSQLTEMLAAHPKVAAVYYPGLKNHPQHGLASELFKAQGSIFSFELNADIDCFDFLNHLKIAISATHLGDNRTLIIPVAHTIFFEMGAERRAAMGIAESLIRVSVGIEDPADLLSDFKQALELS
ncbi:cystathionine gamma-synthase family protein [Solimicrobium silvestre]|uniref:O-acetylhomoserine sulfhydrylase n=1 Tax=Solimicrobium silvestre TaxID=2099400 RepID=A0A2S9GZK3_9BURK|nr:cystathionine gamma-synthase family protein [Solimicrobium silvestre]PRC93165.1 O-acetylhomoserine sulfhydrylase [Solimicrobium silvestre]